MFTAGIVGAYTIIVERFVTSRKQILGKLSGPSLSVGILRSGVAGQKTEKGEGAGSPC